MLCNRIFEYLTLKFDTNLDDAFGVTGTVAKIMQGATLEDITVIPFITDDVLIYNYCANQLPKLLKASAIKFQDRIQLNYNGIFLEVWFTNSLIVIESNTIKVQRTGDIPANIN